MRQPINQKIKTKDIIYWVDELEKFFKYKSKQVREYGYAKYKIKNDELFYVEEQEKK